MNMRDLFFRNLRELGFENVVVHVYSCNWKMDGSKTIPESIEVFAGTDPKLVVVPVIEKDGTYLFDANVLTQVGEAAKKAPPAPTIIYSRGERGNGLN